MGPGWTQVPEAGLRENSGHCNAPRNPAPLGSHTVRPSISKSEDKRRHRTPMGRKHMQTRADKRRLSDWRTDSAGRRLRLKPQHETP